MVKSWCLVGLGVLACNQVLGIDEARLARDGSGAASGMGAAPAAGGMGTAATGGAETGGGAGASGMAGSAGAPSLCDTYCEAVQTNCQEANAQYVNLGSCLEVCSRLPEGTLDQSDENTVHCRLRQARIAEIEPFFACTFAGPAGSGECGSHCESMCTLAMLACDPTEPDQNAGQFYATSEDCLADCEQVADLGSYTTAAAAGQYEGGHVQCRIYHVIAAFGEPDTHCGHVKGIPPCADADGGT